MPWYTNHKQIVELFSNDLILMWKLFNDEAVAICVSTWLRKRLIRSPSPWGLQCVPSVVLHRTRGGCGVMWGAATMAQPLCSSLTRILYWSHKTGLPRGDGLVSTAKALDWATCWLVVWLCVQGRPQVPDAPHPRAAYRQLLNKSSQCLHCRKQIKIRPQLRMIGKIPKLFERLLQYKVPVEGGRLYLPSNLN